jgi:hypothetical protein
MDEIEKWMRLMEARMARVEESIKGLAPVVMLRDMIDPLQRDLLKIANSVQQLTNSDLELKALHKQLMVERAEQEETRHKLELARLQEQLAEQRRLREEARDEHEADRRERGVLVWITKKAHPLVQFFVALAVAGGLAYGLLKWLQANIK